MLKEVSKRTSVQAMHAKIFHATCYRLLYSVTHAFPVHIPANGLHIFKLRASV